MLEPSRAVIPGDMGLTDSSSLLADERSRLLPRLRTDGYLWFRGLLPANEVCEVARLVEEILVRRRWVADHGRLTPELPIRRFGDAEFREAFRAMLQIEELHRLAHHPSLLRLVAGLVDGEVVVHPRKVLRVCFPHSLDPQSTTRPHQDYPYVQGGVEGLTTWVPLTPAPRRRGALAVLAGSASEGIRPMGASDPVLGCGAVDVVPSEDRRWRSGDLEPGDVLLFHSLTVHKSQPNTSPEVRISADFRYRSVAQPLAISEMWPPYDPMPGSWAGLTHGWTTRRWVSVPPGTKIVGTRLPKYGFTVPSSAMAGAPESVLPRNIQPAEASDGSS